MKKSYQKPVLYAQNLKGNNEVRTCQDAEDYWIPVDMGFDDVDTGEPVIIFVPELDCTMTDHEYMSKYGGDDKACLYASTMDGVTFTS